MLLFSSLKCLRFDLILEFPIAGSCFVGLSSGRWPDDAIVIELNDDDVTDDVA